jgi:hypothetical protein
VRLIDQLGQRLRLAQSGEMIDQAHRALDRRHQPGRVAGDGRGMGFRSPGRSG